MQYSKTFAPATVMDAPEGTIVLQKDYLALPKDIKCRISGFFQPPVNNKSLENPSYKVVTKGMTFVGVILSAASSHQLQISQLSHESPGLQRWHGG